MSDPCNIAASLPRLARERPDQVAMRCPGRRGAYDVALTYAQLDARSDAIAAGLAQRGIARGTRTVVMLRPTESSVVFLQQLGRGLRATAGKATACRFGLVLLAAIARLMPWTAVRSACG